MLSRVTLSMSPGYRVTSLWEAIDEMCSPEEIRALEDIGHQLMRDGVTVSEYVQTLTDEATAFVKARRRLVAAEHRTTKAYAATVTRLAA